MPWQEIIGILGTCLMAGLGMLGWSRNHKIDATGTGRESASVLAEIGHVKGGIDEIKMRLDRREREYIDVIGRLTALESTLRQLADNTIQDILRRLERIENRNRRGDDGA